MHTAATAAQMMQPLGRRQRGRCVQRGDVALPAPACPPSPDDQVLDFCLCIVDSMFSCYILMFWQNQPQPQPQPQPQVSLSLLGYSSPT